MTEAVANDVTVHRFSWSWNDSPDDAAILRIDHAHRMAVLHMVVRTYSDSNWAGSTD